MSALMNEDGIVKTFRHYMELIAETFYTNLFRSKIPVPGSYISAGEKPPKILPSEARVAIESMKRGRAPGPDNISSDFLRTGGHNLHVLRANHMTGYLQKQKIPDQWRTSRAVILPRKGNRRDLCNYRSMWLLSVLYKLFTKIILSRISRTLDEAQPVELAGFRKGFCYMDHIQTVFRVIEVCLEYHLPLVLTFVDYEKAFDSVETNAILSAFVDQVVDPSYIRTLSDCYRNCTTKIQLFHRPLTIPIGTKLFGAALQWIMKSLDWDEKGIHFDGKFLSNLCFADDVVIFSRSTSEAEVNELNEAGKKIGFRISRKKTQFLKTLWCEGKKIKLDGFLIAETTSYVLPCAINEHGKQHERGTR